jgi:hypothetical protein
MLMESPLYGVPVEEIARACGVHLDTARRWKRKGSAPLAAIRLIRALWEHDLGGVSRDWDGWKIVKGMLYSPEGEKFTPGDVKAARYYRDMVRELERPRQLGF